MGRSRGEKGLRLSGAGNSVFLSSETGMYGNFELHQGCQVPFRISRRNMGFPLRCCNGKELHLAMTGGGGGNLVVFLELWQDSRVTTGNSGCLLCWPREVQSPFELQGGVQHCSRVTVGESGLKTHWRKNLEVFLRVAAGNPGFPRFVTVISGSFFVCLWEIRDTVECGGASRDSTVFRAMEQGLISS